MYADAVIFDKDGTLIDFDTFWVTVSVKAIEDILKKLGREDICVSEILSAFGINAGVIDIEGVLCKGTYEQLGQILYNILLQRGCNIPCDEVVRMVIQAYNKNADSGEVKPSCPDLADVLTKLKKQNKKLAVVTTDNEEITHKCLDKLGIEELFDKIYTDDGKTPAKPDPYCADDFCKFTGVEKKRVVMVGDTMTDVDFAKNAGIAVIGVAKNSRNRQILAPHADAVITDLSDIFEVLG